MTAHVIESSKKTAKLEVAAKRFGRRRVMRERRRGGRERDIFPLCGIHALECVKVRSLIAKKSMLTHAALQAVVAKHEFVGMRKTQ
jgi:hypothetical protein